MKTAVAKELKQKEVNDTKEKLISSCTEYKASFHNKDFEGLTKLSKTLRYSISTEEKDNPTFKILINNKILPFLTRILQYSLSPELKDHDELVKENAWILTNLFIQSEVLEFFMKEGGHKYFMQLLDHQNEEIISQALWGLANMAGGSIEIRDLLLKDNLFEYIVKLAIGGKLQNADDDIGENLCWLISNMCRSPTPVLEYTQYCVPILVEYLKSDQKSTQQNVVWGLLYLSNKEESLGLIINQIQKQEDNTYLSKLLSFASMDNSTSTRYPSLKIIGNLVATTDEFIPFLIENGIVDLLKGMLKSEYTQFRQDACWVISNLIAAKDDKIAKHFIDVKVTEGEELNVTGFPIDLCMIALQGVNDEKIEALFALSNLLIKAQFEEALILLKIGILEPFKKVQELKNDMVVKFFIQAVQNVFKQGQSQNAPVNPCVKSFYENGGAEILQELQDYDDQQVYQSVADLIDEYFMEDEDQNDEEMKQDIETQEDKNPSISLESSNSNSDINDYLCDEDKNDNSLSSDLDIKILQKPDK